MHTLGHLICLCEGFRAGWFCPDSPGLLRGHWNQHTMVSVSVNQPWRVWINTSREYHDDVIKWKHFPRYWPFVWGIHRSPVNSPHKGQWRWALMFSLICVWINGWVNNREAGDLRRTHYGVTVMHKPGPLLLSLAGSVFKLKHFK